MNYCSLCENPTAVNQDLCSVCQGDKLDEVNDDYVIPIDMLFMVDDDNEYVF